MKRACEHPACSCEHDADKMIEKDGRYYCSSYCASSEADTDVCECGHADCGGG